MKSITVRYFAVFRENAGVGEETLETDAATAADVFNATRERHGSAEPLGHCKVAINDEMAEWDLDRPPGAPANQRSRHS